MYINKSRSRDQDSRHVHIWQKPFKSLLLNRWTDFNKTSHVAPGTRVLHCVHNVMTDLFYGKVSLDRISSKLFK